MSDVEKSKRTTELPFAKPLTGNEVLPVVPNGVTKQATPTQIASLATADSVGLGNVANLAPIYHLIVKPVYYVPAIA